MICGRALAVHDLLTVKTEIMSRFFVDFIKETTTRAFKTTIY